MERNEFEDPSNFADQVEEVQQRERIALQQKARGDVQKALDGALHVDDLTVTTSIKGILAVAKNDLGFELSSSFQNEPLEGEEDFKVAVHLSQKGHFPEVAELIETLPGDRWQRAFFKREESTQALREGIIKTLEWRAPVGDNATRDYEKNCEEIFHFLSWFDQNIHGITATESYLSPEVQKVAGKLFDDLDVANNPDRYDLGKKLLETFDLQDRKLPSGLIEMKAE